MPVIKHKMDFYQNLSFLILISLILFCIPTQTVINILSLRPNYDSGQLFIEPWRLLTGHIVHASWQHLLVNLLNLILLRFVFKEWLSNKQFSFFIIFSALFISLGLWVIGSLSSYIGFSGIFHGLLLYLLLFYWQRSPWIFSIAIVCVLGKVIYEQLFGPSPALEDFINIGVAIDSHALGVMSGLIFWLVEKVLSNKYS